MAAQSQGASPNVDLFDAYFTRADMDRDGRISGNEAVAFFQGSNLPKNVLAQIWTYADQNRTGFLGRAEFYNALKLVTIAQSKRELTPDIVRAAFYGPASAKIPAPQINLPTASGPQPNAVANVNPQVVAVTRSLQHSAFRPDTSQNANINQQYNLSQNNQAIRPPQPAPSGNVRPLHSVASQGFTGAGSAFGFDPSNSRMQVSPGDGKTNGHLTGMVSQAMDRSFSLPSTQAGLIPGASGSVVSAPLPPASVALMPPTSINKSPLPQNGFASGSLFGSDGFSANQAQKKDVVEAISTAVSMPVSSGSVSVSPATPSFSQPGSLQTTQNSLTAQSGGGQLQRMQAPKEHQQVIVQTVPNVPGASPQFADAQSQQQWPRMTPIDLQKYTKLFTEVDKDKDGKITGEEARNLFLSWRLPRDILKQVWDLSDQDNDSMLSVREFCIALYLMERYREGRPLPSVLPSSVMQDLPAAVQTAHGAGHASWGYSHGPQQPPTSGFAARPPTRPSGRPPLPVPAPADSRTLPKKEKAKVPVLEKHLVDQLSEEEQKSLNSKFQEATEADKKVEELEKEIKESREKMEFYRVKMQELILYKSRCDTRLNEVTERVSADKREVELLSKKYEEKYKQSGDVASRLTIEEATFRDIQERKMELYRAIVKLEQDGGTDEKLKARVEQIQSNLEELVKSLNERCKTYGLRAKPTTLVELPFGWQPAIQEGTADWDEDWDKFEDEGFTCVEELTLDVKNVVAPPKTKTKPAMKEESAIKESEKPTASNAEVKVEKGDIGSEDVNGSENSTECAGSVVEKVAENGSAHGQGDPVHVKSPGGSPAAKSSRDSPHNDFNNGDHEKNVGSDVSPSAKEKSSDNGGTSSSFSGYKSFDEPGWGRFDRNDDIASALDVKPASTSKGMEDDDLFGPGSSLSLNPIKTGSKFGESSFLRKGSSIFADSVPSSPFNSSFSPGKSNEGPEHLPSFSRFDSMRSTDYESGKAFPTFDDSDTFGSGPFRSALGSETPRTEVDAFGTGPFRSTFGSETPRTEVDAFGTGPFRSSFGSETPRTEVDAFGTGPFRSSFGSETPRTEVDAFNTGPFRSTFGSETPRDSDPFGSGPFRSTFGSETPRDSDPFGSGPFKSSFGSETPRGESDPFGSVGPFRSSLGSETPRSDWMGSETPREDFNSFGYDGPFKSSFGSETPRSEADPFGSSGPFRSSLGDEIPKRDSDPFGYSGSFKSSYTSETPKGTNNWSAF